ncbi:MAG: AsnC family transcriptional regulator [Thaumarchaeota archaeon]|nr:MAG: AsnC family transcriptional regulator [Nitrososphaerota archaeon]
MRPKHSLDEKDLRILEILQNDGRASYSQISRKLGMSEAAIYSRIQKLLKLGVIRRFQAILDPEKLGFTLTAFIAITAQPAKYEEVLKALAEIPEVQEIYDVTGDYYCLVKLRTRGRESLAKILDQIGSLDGVASTETRIVLRTIKEDYALPLTKHK